MAKNKILVVEDERLVAKDIADTIKNIGYNVTATVNRGDKAIEEIEQNRPDLVIMDVKLKGKMTGIDTAKEIKERFNIPVIFLSAYSDRETLSKAKLAEPYGYLLKPFKEKELLTNIETAIYKAEKDHELMKEKELYSSLVQNKNGDTQDSIFVRADYRLNKINFKDILYVEALKDYVVITTTDNSYTTHTTMKEMVRILPKKNFVRIHRSFIVNISKIYSIKYPDLVIEDQMKVLPIGGLYRKELYSRLNMI